MYYSTTYSSPVGTITLGGDGENLVGLWIEGQKYFGDTVSGDMSEKDGPPVFTAAKRWLDRYFAGKKPLPSELPLRPAGGEFRQRIWKILCGIPYGDVTTYGAIAGKMAKQTGKESMSSQAVGGAVAHNPISIIIPCHRVVGTGGSLTGYSAGVAAKAKLLAHEGVNMPHLFVPPRGTAL